MMEHKFETSFPVETGGNTVNSLLTKPGGGGAGSGLVGLLVEVVFPARFILILGVVVFEPGVVSWWPAVASKAADSWPRMR